MCGGGKNYVMGHFHERIADEFAGDPGVSGLTHDRQASCRGSVANVFSGFNFGTASAALGARRA